MFIDRLFKKKTFNFSKNPAGVFSHNLKWEKNPAGENPVGIFVLKAHNNDKHFLCHFKCVLDDNFQNKLTFNFFKNPVVFPNYLKWEKTPVGEKPCGGILLL